MAQREKKQVNSCLNGNNKVKMSEFYGKLLLPAGVRGGLQTPLCIGLPHAIGQIVSDGRHDFNKFKRPLIQVKRANAGQVCAEVTMDTRTLNTDQSTQIQTGPVGVWTDRGESERDGGGGARERK